LGEDAERYLRRKQVDRAAHSECSTCLKEAPTDGLASSPEAEFLGRLAVLVPRPRINLILYHGVLGPRAAWRAEVVRRHTSGDVGDAGLKDSATAQAREADPAETARRQALGQCWASLMERIFGFDVLWCPRGGGRLRLIALIEEAAVINRILPACRPRSPRRVLPARRRSPRDFAMWMGGTLMPRCSTLVPDVPQ
jgi:hypothetical protein